MVKACRAMVLLDCWQTWEEVKGGKGDREIRVLKVALMEALGVEGLGEPVRWTALGSKCYSVHAFIVEGERFVWWLSAGLTGSEEGPVESGERPSGFRTGRLDYPKLSSAEREKLKRAVRQVKGR